MGTSVVCLIYLLTVFISSNGDPSVLAHNSEPWKSFKPLSILLVTGPYTGHLFPLVSLGEELVRRGHNVTLCATMIKGSPLYPDVPERVGVRFESAGYDDLTQDDFEEIHMLMQSGVSNFTNNDKLLRIAWPSLILIRAKVEEIGVEHFDIMIAEAAAFPLGVYFHRKGMRTIILCTLISMFPSALPSWSTPLPSSGQLDDLSFFERLLNTLLMPFLYFFANEIYLSVTRVDENYKKAFDGIDPLFYPGLHIPLIFNTVPGLDFPKPTYPLIEHVGPVLMNSLPELDERLQEWLDSKENRTVIYISMGTTGYLAADTAQGILDGVMATAYSAVWVLKTRNRKTLSQVNFEVFKDRLFLADWVPQQTVLQHRAIVMSLLHCGLNGIQESLYNSLPVICIPTGYDQYEVATKVVSAGVGISLQTLTDSLRGNRIIRAETITNSIQRIISDNYAENASKISRMFKLAGGAKRAADLVEFYEDVGYEHLVPSFVKYEWSWVQYYDVDVWLVLGVVCGVLGWMLWRLGNKCICCC